MEELMRSKNLGFNTFSPDERLDDRISFAVLQQHLHGRILHILPAELFFRLLWMLSELREKCVAPNRQIIELQGLRSWSLVQNQGALCVEDRQDLAHRHLALFSRTLIEVFVMRA